MMKTITEMEKILGTILKIRGTSKGVIVIDRYDGEVLTTFKNVTEMINYMNNEIFWYNAF